MNYEYCVLSFVTVSFVVLFYLCFADLVREQDGIKVF